MRKLTSHFCITPHGLWAKRPVIKINNEGKIVEYREMGDSFKEEVSLEYFPGIIIPSFIGVIDSKFKGTNGDIRQMVVDGCRRYILESELSFKLPAFVSHKTVCQSTDFSNVNPWDQVKEDVNKGMGLAEAIMEQTLQKAKEFKVYPEWGSVQEGSSPGLLLLQGIDMRTFSLTAQTKIKVLVN